MNHTNFKNLEISDFCVPLVDQGRVSPHWPGPGPRGADNGQCLQPTVCCYPGIDLRGITGGGGCLFNEARKS